MVYLSFLGKRIYNLTSIVFFRQRFFQPRISRIFTNSNPLRVFHDFVEGLNGSCSVTGRQGFASARPINYVESSISCGFVKFVVLLICVRKAFVFRAPHLRCSAWYESSGCEIQDLTTKVLVPLNIACLSIAHARMALRSASQYL